MGDARPIIAVAVSWPNADIWQAALEAAAPDFTVQAWTEITEPARVAACVVWQAPPELFARFPLLQVVHSAGAGVEHLWQLGDALPDRLPVLRLVDPVMTERLAQWVLAGVLFFQRHFDRYFHQQQAHRWQRHDHLDAGETVIGVLGLGVMGTAIARVLQANNFAVLGWSRTPKTLPGITTHAGEAGLQAVAARAHMLASALPLTPATQGLLNARLFAAMPAGGFIINAGRGAHVVRDDLLAALDSGQLEGALLDVFTTEPLPENDPFWRHPKVWVHPHAAAISNPRTGAAAMAEGIRAVLRGERPPNIALRERGY